MAYQFSTGCVNSTAELIDAMTETSREITWRTFSQHVPAELLQATAPFSMYQYHGEHTNPITGEQTCPLHLSNDYAVTFHKGTYDGKPCYYIVHSCIEYIFQER